MNNKYEQLVEFIINDETDKARELFHEIVVEKSRDIYESLVAEEDLDEVGGNEVEDLVDEVSLDEEGISEEEESETDAEEENGAEEFDLDAEEEHEDEEGVEARVDDLEAALDELKAEFDALMAGEEGEEEHADLDLVGDEGPEEEQGEFFEAKEEDEEDLDESKEEDEEAEEVDENIVREYVEKVGDTGQGSEGKMVGTGAKTPAAGGKNTKSIVASKNDMGGTAVTSKGGNANQDGNRPAATEKPKGELVSNPQNKPGANAGKTAFKTKESSTGAEGKLAGNDGSVAINKQSPLRKA